MAACRTMSDTANLPDDTGRGADPLVRRLSGSCKSRRTTGLGGGGKTAHTGADHGAKAECPRIHLRRYLHPVLPRLLSRRRLPEHEPLSRGGGSLCAVRQPEARHVEGSGGTHHSSGNRAKRLSIDPSARRFSSLPRAHSTKRTRGWLKRARRASTKGRSLRLRPTSNAGWTRPGRRLRLRPRRSRMQFRQRILRRLLLRPRTRLRRLQLLLSTPSPRKSQRRARGLRLSFPRRRPHRIMGSPHRLPPISATDCSPSSRTITGARSLSSRTRPDSPVRPLVRVPSCPVRAWRSVLTGGAGPQMLRQAREEFLAADLGSAMTAGDRRYVSPRVLEQLERR